MLSEVEQVCTRVAMISHGRIVHEGRVDELRGATRRRYRIEPTDPERAAAACRAQPAFHDVRVEDGVVVVGVDDDEALVALTRTLAQAGVGIRALVPETDSLERLFFELTDAPAVAG